MSTRREDFGTELEMFAGTEKDFELIVERPDNNLAKDLSDTNLYNTGKVKIFKPDGTIIADIAITYKDRPNGIIGWTVPNTIATNANAGNWIGNMELINNVSKIIDQQLFNFNIRENY